MMVVPCNNSCVGWAVIWTKIIQSGSLKWCPFSRMAESVCVRIPVVLHQLIPFCECLDRLSPVVVASYS